MDLLLVDYITKTIALLALGNSAYLLVTNFEPKSIVIKLLYTMAISATIGLLMTISFYFVKDVAIIIPIDWFAGILNDIAASTVGIASLLRLKELLPLFLKFSTTRKTKIFENSIRITNGFIIFSLVRNVIKRTLYFAGYTTGWVYAIFYFQAAVILYFACMVSDLIGCTWTTIYIFNFFTEKKLPLNKTFKLKVSMVLLYITGILAAITGSVSVDGKFHDVLDNIATNAIAVYYAFVIRVLLGMKKLCDEAFKIHAQSSHGYAGQGQ